MELFQRMPQTTVVFGSLRSSEVTLNGWPTISLAPPILVIKEGGKTLLRTLAGYRRIPPRLLTMGIRLITLSWESQSICQCSFIQSLPSGVTLWADRMEAVPD